MARTVRFELTEVINFSALAVQCFKPLSQVLIYTQATRKLVLCINSMKGAIIWIYLNLSSIVNMHKNRAMLLNTAPQKYIWFLEEKNVYLNDFF